MTPNSSGFWMADSVTKGCKICLGMSLMTSRRRHKRRSGARRITPGPPQQLGVALKFLGDIPDLVLGVKKTTEWQSETLVSKRNVG